MWLNASLDKENLTCPKLPERRNVLAFWHQDGSEPVSDVGDSPQPLSASHVFKAYAKLVFKIQREGDKDIFCLSLSAPDIKELAYEPGDTIGILAENKESTVFDLLNNNGDICKLNQQIHCAPDNPKNNHLPKVTTPKHLLTHFVNVSCLPQKTHLQMLSTFCSDPKEKRILQVLCSREGAELYRKLIMEAGVTVVDIIEGLPSCKPDSLNLATFLPRLSPRPYSIASSPLASEDIRIVFSVLPGNRAGLCTGMLKDLFEEKQERTVQMYLRKSHGFRLPKNPDVPLILVGPGTGIAPYVGFLQHRKYSKCRGKALLFTGFRTREDFLFREEIQEYLSEGFLTELFVSYSRENEEGDRYVQNKIKQKWREIGELMDAGGVIYQCGDLKAMAQSVPDAFAEAFQSYYDIDSSEAQAKVKMLKSDKRYLTDVWC